VKEFSSNVKVITPAEAQNMHITDPGFIAQRPKPRKPSYDKSDPGDFRVNKRVIQEESPVKDTQEKEESEVIDRVPALVQQSSERQKNVDSFDYNEDDLATVGADIKMGKVVPQFTEIKVKSKLDHSQPTRIDRNDADGQTEGKHEDGSESDFGDLEFADIPD
jgi:hypothetical protein